MQATFLLIDEAREHYWPELLSDALAPYGTLYIKNSEDAILFIRQACPDLIVIDATELEDIPALIARLRTECPAGKIVVVTASPTWTRARAAFRAGALEYIRKSVNVAELRTLFESIITVEAQS